MTEENIITTDKKENTKLGMRAGVAVAELWYVLHELERKEIIDMGDSEYDESGTFHVLPPTEGKEQGFKIMDMLYRFGIELRRVDNFDFFLGTEGYGVEPPDYEEWDPKP